MKTNFLAGLTAVALAGTSCSSPQQRQEPKPSEAAVVAPPSSSVPENASYPDLTPDPGAVAFDALVVRPACLVSTILGTAIFVISLPVAATSHSIEQTRNALIVLPAKATFTTPLGEFESQPDAFAR